MKLNRELSQRAGWKLCVFRRTIVLDAVGLYCIVRFNFPFYFLFYFRNFSMIIILPLQVRVGKLEGKQGGNAFYYVGAVGTIEQEADGMMIALLYTGNDLTAGTTRGNGLREETFCVTGCYGQGEDGLIRVLGVGSKECSTLGTQA